MLEIEEARTESSKKFTMNRAPHAHPRMREVETDSSYHAPPGRSIALAAEQPGVISAMTAACKGVTCHTLRVARHTSAHLGGCHGSSKHRRTRASPRCKS